MSVGLGWKSFLATLIGGLQAIPCLMDTKCKETALLLSLGLGLQNARYPKSSYQFSKDHSAFIFKEKTS